ncbi:MAG TPA: hypothetical protein VE781_12370, partial [Kineosporiaceae bacterium]|nr:hypothetical protein [Kineosporiaceae bacterium]
VDFGDGSGIALPDGDNSLCTGKDTIRHQYDRPGTYTLVMHVRDVLGRDGQARLTVTVGDAYLPVSPAPVRVYAKRVPAHGTVTLTAKDLRADGGDDAALLDVTVTAAQRAGAVAVVPRGRSATGRSNVRFTAGRPATGLVRAVPSGGRVSLVNASAGAITLTVDVVGVVNHEVVGQAYVPLPATAVLDTRAGVGAPKAPLGSRRELALRLAGVPGDATSVALDVSASRATAAGALAVHMYGTARPRTPQLVWTKGQPAANLVVVPVRSGRVLLGATGAGTVDVAATVVGYYRGAGRGSFFVPTAPQRLVDTAAGVGVRRGARLQPGQALRVQLAGRSGRPATGITAADLTVTASGGRAGSVVTFASDGTAASAPSVAFGPGAPGSRLLTVPTGADGAVVLVNQGPVPVDLVVDLDGYYVVGPGA